ncbi:MAG: GTP 3',8-cyclase MoaA [Bacteroidetes bacterium]|nr:GTP 3',8-cyclase MoaA [Bacteroidota bacterium]MDA0873446.1 GTP 3',8-cyclase MoaA [Bacteroidota bacterium]
MNAPDPTYLTDAFGRRHTYLRISLTERCNLRCTYCMPAEGVELKPKSHILSFEEILRLSSLLVGQGVTKIRLTGGEPLIRKELVHLVERLRSLDGLRELTITTNGLLLPRKLEELRRAGITGFNISLDTLRKDRFEEITRRPGLDTVLEAIHRTVDAGYDPVKINCVVIRGFNEDELVDFVAMTRDLPIEMRFIEYMPFDGNTWNTGKFLPYVEMVDRIREVWPDFRSEGGDELEIAKLWQVQGFTGKVGFITSMSDHFCAGCNRIRITADGQLKVCLFGAQEVNLRDLMRDGTSDEALLEAVRSALARKAPSHAGMETIAASENRPMILIGG